jgi:hypothetical protein
MRVPRCFSIELNTCETLSGAILIASRLHPCWRHIRLIEKLNAIAAPLRKFCAGRITMLLKWRQILERKFSFLLFRSMV